MANSKALSAELLIYIILKESFKNNATRMDNVQTETYRMPFQVRSYVVSLAL
jgi:hypothetical protein